jgi:hypothetical protein
MIELALLVVLIFVLEYSITLLRRHASRAGESSDTGLATALNGQRG